MAFLGLHEIANFIVLYRSALSGYISNRKLGNLIPSATSISTGQITSSYLANMKSCINGGTMPLMVILNGLQAHWVNLLAFYDYANGNTYVRILNNWDGDYNRYYLYWSGGFITGAITSVITAKITI